MILSQEQMRVWIKSSIAKYKTQAEAAKSIGISPAYLNDILKSRREISEEVARKFDFQREIIFTRDPIPYWG